MNSGEPNCGAYDAQEPFASPKMTSIAVATDVISSAIWRNLPGVRDGRDVLAQLAEWAGKPWPSTYMVATANGGWHLYFTAPEGSGIRNSASLLGPQVDVRAAGGYVVAAGLGSGRQAVRGARRR